MSGDLSRQTREATDHAVFTALEDAGDSGAMPSELATALPSISSRTITTSLIRLAAAGRIRRDSERGRAYALPVHPDGSPMSAEDISAEAAAQRAEFLARRDAAVVVAESASHVDLRKVHPRLKPIATARNTYLQRFVAELRQCDTPTAYDAVNRAFDVSTIEDEWDRIKLELKQEEDRQKALEEQKKEWEKQRALTNKQRKALPAGNPDIQWQAGKPSKKRARVNIRKDWQPTANQVLLPQTAPANAQLCRFCEREQYPSPAMYYVIGPLFPNGEGLCDRHAEAERYGPETQIYLIRWS